MIVEGVDKHEREGSRCTHIEKVTFTLGPTTTTTTTHTHNPRLSAKS